jgi:superoxide reductase
MEPVKFYRCKTCGNLFGVVHDSGAVPECCGGVMELLKANSTDAAQEKHVPVIEKADGKVVVKVGSAAHPMLDEHYIQWIALRQGNRMQRVQLKPGEKPEATFFLYGDGPIEAYAYCNLHGLWKS